MNGDEKVRRSIESLKQKEKERDEFLNESLERLSNLARDLKDGRIDKDAYDKEHEEIKKNVSLLNSKISSLKSMSGINDLDEGDTEKELKHSSLKSRNPMLYLFLIIVIIPLGIYLLSQYYTCVPVNISTKILEIFDLLNVIEKNSPKDHDMICKYVDGIDYIYTSMSYAGGRGGNIRLGSEYVLTDEHGISKTERASIIVHEACHIMMGKIMGGRYPMTEKEVERPCERMRYMFLYRAGHFRTYQEMVNGLSREQYGRERLIYTGGIPQILQQFEKDKIYMGSGDIRPYCSKTDITVKKINIDENRFDVQIKNNGTTLIHCGFINLDVGGKEYPIDCMELNPGEVHTTSRNLQLKQGQSISIEVVGCKKKIMI